MSASFSNPPHRPTSVDHHFISLQQKRDWDDIPNLYSGRQRTDGFAITSAKIGEINNAIWIERDGLGWIVRFSIIDIDTWITKGDELDQYALNNSAYNELAGSTTPMLPKELSEGVFSLLENEKRPTKTVLLPFDSHLNMSAEPQLEHTYILSAKTLDYAQANVAILDKSARFNDQFKMLLNIAKKLFGERRKQGALAHFDFQTGFIVTEECGVKKVGLKEILAYMMMQEFRIATNYAIARLFAQKDVRTLFRSQATRAEINRNHTISEISHAFTAGNEVEITRTMAEISKNFEPAVYVTTPGEHSWMRVAQYVKAVSPLSNYADLIVNRSLTALMRKEAAPYDERQFQSLSKILNEAKIPPAQKTLIKPNQDPEPIKTKLLVSPISTLSARGFRKIIQSCIDLPEVPADIFQEINRRIANQSFHESDIGLVLLENRSVGESWVQIKESLAKILIIRPNIALTILSGYCSNHGIQAPKILISNAAPFRAQASIRVSDKEFISGYYEAPNKKAAAHMATLDLLFQLGNLAQLIKNINRVETGKSLPIRFSGLEAALESNPWCCENPKSELLELKHKMRWQTLEFQTFEVSKHHQFRSLITLRGKEVEITLEGAVALGKKRAEQQAASQVLIELKRRGLWISNLNDKTD